MILLNDFFFIVEQQSAVGSVVAKILINEKHKIFEGHFPGMPVVPGVCMIQIVMEMLELVTGKQIRLVSSDTIKFLAVINPQINKEVDVRIHWSPDSDAFLVNATLFADSRTFFKLKAIVTLHNGPGRS
jgi:3-hydroxyacyl-[acyl-carrier-protein] dehydratase